MNALEMLHKLGMDINFLVVDDLERFKGTELYQLFYDQICKHYAAQLKLDHEAKRTLLFRSPPINQRKHEQAKKFYLRLDEIENGMKNNCKIKLRKE